ncbi:MAG: hypothetical protein QOF46_325 [Paraburkholderia sp.]|nr:hypothetical protein [Paraburkholderia sp.]
MDVGIVRGRALPNVWKCRDVTEYNVYRKALHHMDSQPFSYKQHVIVPFASISKLGYAASVFVTRPTGKCRAFGILAYFVSENAALQYAAAYAKAHIDGTTLPNPPFTRIRSVQLPSGSRTCVTKT